MTVFSKRILRARWLAALVIVGGTAAAVAAQQPPRSSVGAPIVPVTGALPAAEAPSPLVAPTLVPPTLVVPPTPAPAMAPSEPPVRMPAPSRPAATPLPTTPTVPSMALPPMSAPAPQSTVPTFPGMTMPPMAAPAPAVETPIASMEAKPAPRPEDEPLDKPFRTAVRAVSAPTAPPPPIPHTVLYPVAEVPSEAHAPVPVHTPVASNAVIAPTHTPEPTVTRVPRNVARTASKPIIQVVQEDSEDDATVPADSGKPDVSTIRVVIGREPNMVSGPSVQTPAPMPASTIVSVGGAVTPASQSTVVSEVSASGSCVSCGTVGCGGGCGTGCSKWRSCWDCVFAPATVPPVLGSTTQSIFMMQKNAALAEYFVVYREDFLANTNTLNKTGERHVEGILRRMNQTGAPLKVEPTGNPDFDQRRRVTIVEALMRNGVPAQEAQARVIIGGTRAEGLRGLDIESLPYPNLMGGMGGMGGGMGGFGGGMGGFGGGMGGFGGGMGGFGGIR